MDFLQNLLQNKNTTFTVFPQIVSAETILFEFGNPKVTVHKAKGHST